MRARPKLRVSAAGSATVRSFVRCINRADVDGLLELMTERHVFVDALGSRTRGRRKMREAWLRYFQMVPGYRAHR